MLITAIALLSGMVLFYLCRADRPLAPLPPAQIEPRDTLKQLCQSEQTHWSQQQSLGHYDYESCRQAQRQLKARLSRLPPSQRNDADTRPLPGAWRAGVLLLLLLAMAAYCLRDHYSGERLWRQQLAAQSTRVERLLAEPEAATQLPRDQHLSQLCRALQIHLQSAWPLSANDSHALGRCYLQDQQYPMALGLLQSAHRQAPEHSGVALALADTLFHTDATAPLIGRLLHITLQQRPRSTQALQLLGRYHHQRAEYRAAIQAWQQLLAQIEPDSKQARNVQAAITQAQRLDRE